MEYCPRLGCRPFRADSSAGLSWAVESRSDAVADAPFSDPAHQTGRAVFPHPAFGQGLYSFGPRQMGAEALQSEQAERLIEVLVPEAVSL